MPSVVALRAGRAELGIAPAVGGAIVYYRTKTAGRSHDWLRAARPADLASGVAGRLSCFPLVPFSNRIRNGTFEFAGQRITLPLNLAGEPHAEHGHGWQSPWTIADQSVDRLTIVYDHAPDAWPFPYRAQQEFALAEDELAVRLSVENRGGATMPVGLGLHPYFPGSARCRLAARVDAMWATDAEVMPTALVAADPRLGDDAGLPVAETPFDNAFTGWRRSARIDWPERNARLTLVADPPLDFLVVYTPAGKGYFCAEPVSHCTDAFNLAAQGRRDTGMLTLDPDASVSATVRFRPSLA
jgi:aldose 1-epimerase